MKPRHTILATGLTCLLSSQSVMGLGLGEIIQRSSLNEPLDAEVELVGIGDLSELEILVNLGSKGDFAQAGVDRDFFLTGLKFAVDLSNPQRPFVHITSQKPVKEPYLDFLMEVQWPSGRLLREYTLLLDLPVFAEGTQTAKPIEAASVARQPRTPNQTTAAQPPRARVDAPNVSAGDEYRVQSGDTLWDIAEEIRPAGSTVHQTMVAILRHNQNAFINGDAHLLKSGSVLRLPEGAEISRIDRGEAIGQIGTKPVAAEGNVASLDNKETTDALLDASGSETATSGGSQPTEGRLKLAVSTPEQQATGLGNDNVSGNQDSTSSRNSGLDGENIGSEVIQNNLAIVQEELDKTSRENQELRERVGNLEQQIETISRMMELNDPTLAALQQSVGEADKVIDANTETDIGTVADTDAGAGIAAVDQQDNAELVAQGNTEAPEQASEEPAPAAETAAAAEPAPIPASDIAGTSEEVKQGFDWQRWLDLLLYPLIGLVVVLLTVFLFFRNRGDDESEDLFEQEEPLLAAESEQEETEDSLDALTEEELVIASELGEKITEEDLSGLELTEEEGVDPEGEADIYLSLGNYDQAEKVLLEALDNQPKNTALHLKLLEVYVATRSLASFDAQLQELDALGDAEASEKAQALRSELADTSGKAGEYVAEDSPVVDDDWASEAPSETEETQPLEETQLLQETATAEEPLEEEL